MRDISQSKEELEQKITTRQCEADLKLMKSVWSAHVRTPEEDDPIEECVREHPRGCLCCNGRTSGTYSMPIKGWSTPLRTLSRLRTTSLLLFTKGQATYTLTRT